MTVAGEKRKVLRRRLRLERKRKVKRVGKSLRKQERSLRKEQRKKPAEDEGEIMMTKMMKTMTSLWMKKT